MCTSGESVNSKMPRPLPVQPGGEEWACAEEMPNIRISNPASNAAKLKRPGAMREAGEVRVVMILFCFGANPSLALATARNFHIGKAPRELRSRRYGERAKPAMGTNPWGIH